MSRGSLCALLGLCVGWAATYPTAVTAAAAEVEVEAEATPELQLPGDVRPTLYVLNLKIDPERPEFRGSAEITVTLDKPRQVLWLHGRELTVTESSVRVGDETLPTRYEEVTEEGVVKLTLPKAVGPGKATLHFAWSRVFDPRLVGVYLAHESGATYAYTQFEDIFARRAFPGFDEPAFKAPFDVTLTVPSADVAIANTLPLSEEPAGPGRKRIHYALTRPLPMRGIAPKGRGAELAYALKIGVELLLLEEKYFGVPYPYSKLDHVAVPDFAWGGMENAGEIHYRADLLLFKEGTSAEEKRIGIAQLMAHEQAHQWFGDLVTMRWWTEAWLNEAFATWMGYGIVAQWQPRMLSTIDLQKSVSGAMWNDALVSARAIRQPLTSTKNIIDQFDVHTYQKGGGVLAMFEKFAGREAFRRGVSAYVASHADGGGSTDELLASISKAAGRDLTTAFHTFLDQPGSR